MYVNIVSNKLENPDYEMGCVTGILVAICYAVLGFFTSVMSGIGTVLPITIYAGFVTFFVGSLILRANVSDAQGFSGIVFVISSIIFLHTSAPIWSERQYCDSQYGMSGTGSYSFNRYGELAENESITSEYDYCLYKGGYAYMMDKGEVQPTLFWISLIGTIGSGFILFGSSMAPLFSSVPQKRQSNKSRKKSVSKKGIIYLDEELLKCEEIVSLVSSRKKGTPKKLQKAFYRRLMKLSDMLNYFGNSLLEDNDYYSRSERIERLLKFARKKANETFDGDKNKIKDIREKLTYSPGEGYFFENQWDKWWKNKL